MTLLLKYFKFSLIFLIRDIWLYVLTFPILILIKVFNKFLKIRFGKCRIDVIGNSFFNLDSYLGELKLSKKRYNDFFYTEGKSCNSFFLKLAQRNLKIYWFIKYFYEMSKFLPGTENLQIIPEDYRAIGNGGTDPNKIISKTRDNIIFKDNEDKLGYSFLENTGIKNNKYICFIYRNSAYKKKSFLSSEIDFSYHDYRNSELEDYKEALNYLTDQGYYIIRMGKSEDQPIQMNNKKIIDYSFSKKRSDFLDIWLMSKCYFCFTSGTGLDDVAIAFRKPLLHVNQIPISGIRTYYPNILCIFKKIKKSPTNKIMNLSDIIKSNSDYLLHSEKYKKKNLSILNNTSKEIVSVTKEMHLRMVNNWPESENSKKEQDLFWKNLSLSKNFSAGYRWINRGCKVGSKFLEDNKNFLN